MNLELQKKVFIVSGGAKGIGRAIVEELAKEGAIPVILGRSKEAGEALAAALQKEGKEVLNLRYELSAPANCKAAIEQTIERYGRIDGIVNNAGVNDSAGLEAGIEKFEQSVKTNLFHYYYLVHYALEALKESQGAIVNISSKTALTGQGGTSGYAASKGAQLALTREWAVELLPYGIRVNAIVPAEVMTPLYRKWLDSFDKPEEKLQSIVSKIPLAKRMTTAEEIASTCVFLLSSKSGHTTGQWLIVDGGYVHLDRSIT